MAACRGLHSPHKAPKTAGQLQPHTITDTKELQPHTQKSYSHTQLQTQKSYSHTAASAHDSYTGGIGLGYSVAIYK